MATVGLKHSLRNISSISLMMVGDGLGVVGLLMFIAFTGRLLVFIFIMVIIVCLFRDLLFGSFAVIPMWQAIKFPTSGWSQPHLFYQPCKGGTSSNSPATLTALTGWYGWWSIFCWFELLSNNASSSTQMVTLLTDHEDAHFGKMPPSSLFVMARSLGLIN